MSADIGFSKNSHKRFSIQNAYQLWLVEGEKKINPGISFEDFSCRKNNRGEFTRVSEL